MTVTNLQTLKENIEADATEVSQQFGSEEVEFIFMKYGATNLDDLDPATTHLYSVSLKLY